MSRVEILDEGCWIWTGSRAGGYGTLRVDGKVQKTHRLSYAEFIGQIPDGLCVCHHCDNPPCFNPDHLFLGTHNDNMQDMKRKGRSATGEKSSSVLYPKARGEDHWAFNKPELVLKGESVWCHKLTEKDVLYIRAHPELPSKGLARTFSVDDKTIRSARNRETWRHI
jgi:hypothetical protein